MKTLKTVFLTALLGALVLTSGCQIGGTPDAAIAAFERDAMITHLAQVEPDAGVRAAAPYYPVSGYGIKNDSIPLSATTASYVLANYPEAGQTSTLSTSKLSSPANTYKIIVSTVFPSSSVQQSQLEVYYIEDLAPFGTYGVADRIVDPTHGYSPDSLFRERIETVLIPSNGSPSTRLEQIEADSFTAPSVSYAAFDINGSLEWATVSGSTPAAGTSIWSSKVTYTQTQTGISNFASAQTGFPSSGAYTTAGTRYYTEVTKDATFNTNSTLWIEQVSAPGGAPFVRTITRETYDINKNDGTRSQKTLKSKSLIYDSVGDLAFSLDKSNWLQAILLRLF